MILSPIPLGSKMLGRDGRLLEYTEYEDGTIHKIGWRIADRSKEAIMPCGKKRPRGK